MVVVVVIVVVVVFTSTSCIMIPTSEYLAYLHMYVLSTDLRNLVLCLHSLMLGAYLWGYF